MRDEINREGKIGLLLILFLLVILFINLTSAATRNCYGCLNCTAEIGNASAGDIVQLNNNITNYAGTCIDFNGRSNITFDCFNFSNSIDGDDSGTDYGINLTSVNNNTIKNCNVSDFYEGIYLQSSSNNTLVNNIANSNYDTGISLIVSSLNNTLINIIANSNRYGIYLHSSSNNALTNITANSNVKDGILLTLTSNNNIFINSTFQENNDLDVDISGLESLACANNFTNINGSGGRAIEYYSNTSVIENKTLSELILCNADNSSIKNITIYGSNSKYNNMLYFSDTDNTNISEVNSSQNYYGIFLSSSSRNVLINNTLTLNSDRGIYLSGSNNNTLINNTVNSNLFGIYFQSSLNNTITNNIINLNPYGIEFISSSNNTLINNTVTNSPIDGIYFQSCLDNILINNTVNSSSRSGIFLFSSSNNTLVNNIANSNSYYGIYLSSSSNNTLINNTVQENDFYDIFIVGTSSFCNNILINTNGSGGRAIEYYSNTSVIENKTLSELILCNADNSSIKNITIYGSNSKYNNMLYISDTDNTNISEVNSSRNYQGIYLYLSLNITLTNITTNYNSQFGVLLYSSNSSILTSITTKNNSKYGIAIQGGSYNNTIRNSFIQYNNVSGLLLNSSGTAPQYNTFYNNYFNNSAQYSNISAVSTNYFNTTKTAGTNIVGGNYLAGNYWAALNGTGFSQTCADTNGDGICDASYQLDAINYDYLPLTCTESWSCTSWSSCSGGTQTRTCTDANLCQTYRTRPVESQTCSGTGDSAVPGAGASQTSAISSITPTEPAVIEITNHYMSATRITINVNAPVSDVSLTITEVNISSGGFQIGFQGLPYQAFEITMKNLSNAEIQNASIEFKVNKTELLAHNLTIDDVFLYRKPANETDWSALNTTYLSNDTNYYYFSSVTPGFSTFLIFASKEECIPAEKRCFQNQVQFCLGNKRWLISEVCDYKCQNGKCIEKGLQINLNPLVVYPIIGIVVVGVLISFFAQRMVKRRMRKRRRR